MLAGLAGCLPSSDDAGGSECGPSTAVVERALDGDTVELSDGTRVRYILVDTPELSTEDCWSDIAHETNRNLVEGRDITLTYDAECVDAYGRLLAYVEVDGVDVNARLVEQGHACVLHISPNGDARADEFMNLEFVAQQDDIGMWGACDLIACDD
jgi:micrococcal nuclease